MSAEYGALVEKVDAFVASTTARRSDSLRCTRGCEACCHVWLSVGAVEAEAVRAGLGALPQEARDRVRERGRREQARAQVAARGSAREQDSEHGEARCAFLEQDGSCAIYAQRPLVCRSQGQALRYPEGFVPEASVRMRIKSGAVTWCPLNYTDTAPRGEDVLDAERVDQILAVVTRRHVAQALEARGSVGEQDDGALLRVTLSDLAAEG